MKLLIALLSAVVVATALPFPLGNLLQGAKNKRQIPTQMTPRPAQNMVPVYQCACFDVARDQLECLPKDAADHAYPGMNKGWSCSCWESMVEISDECPLFPGRSNDSMLLCPVDWYPQYFDVFALDSVIVRNRASIDGRLAAAMDIQLNNFTVNYMPRFEADHDDMDEKDLVGISCSNPDLLPQKYRYAIVAGDELRLAQGHVLSGDIVYGASESAGNFSGVIFSSGCQSKMNASLIEFARWGQVLIDLSEAASELELSGNTTFESNILRFKGTRSSELEVFNVSSTWLSQARSIEFADIADDVKGIVLNVAQANADPAQANFTFQLPALDFKNLFGKWGDKILWNFGKASALQFQRGSIFYGAVLAPYARLSSPLPTFYGPLWVLSIDADELIVEKADIKQCWGTLIAEQDDGTTTMAPTSTATTASATTRVAARK